MSLKKIVNNVNFPLAKEIETLIFKYSYTKQYCPQVEKLTGKKCDVTSMNQRIKKLREVGRGRIGVGD